jgi:hypothetical protein
MAGAGGSGKGETSPASQLTQAASAWNPEASQARRPAGLGALQGSGAATKQGLQCRVQGPSYAKSCCQAQQYKELLYSHCSDCLSLEQGHG